MESKETDRVLASVLEASGTSLDEFRSPKRKQRMFFARMAYAKIRRDMGAKTEDIGREIGRDHSTVSRLVEQHDSDVRNWPPYRDFFQKVKNVLYATC